MNLKELADKYSNIFLINEYPDAVRELQTALNENGAALEVDGVVGELTGRAFNKFKADAYLGEPNMIGPDTYYRLKRLGPYDTSEDAAHRSAEGDIYITGIGNVGLNDPIIKGGHFYWYEATYGGTRTWVKRDITENVVKVAEALEEVRRVLNVPLIVTSWYRDATTNRMVGGAPKSYHLTGGAVDFLASGWNKYDAAKAVRKYCPSVGGIGIYPHNAVHVDVGPKRKWGW